MTSGSGSEREIKRKGYYGADKKKGKRKTQRTHAHTQRM